MSYKKQKPRVSAIVDIHDDDKREIILQNYPCEKRETISRSDFNNAAKEFFAYVCHYDGHDYKKDEINIIYTSCLFPELRISERDYLGVVYI
jgi:hypothetical protein